LAAKDLAGGGFSGEQREQHRQQLHGDDHSEDKQPASRDIVEECGEQAFPDVSTMQKGRGPARAPQDESFVRITS